MTRLWQLAAIIIAGLFVVAALPVLTAVAQTADIEIGKNYDIQDFGNGQKRWSSHPERIQVNNQWQNYKLTDSSSNIKFESQAIGSLQYDKASCSFTIYPAGYIAGQSPLLPSVSWIARVAQNGTDVWSQLDSLNSASCQINTSQSKDGIIITATKQTPTLKLTHTINANIYNGIKETVKIDNNDPTLNNHKFAFTQTVQTGQTLTLGNQTYNISQASGTVLDRNWIENNKAKIFEIANKLSYNFDKGFDYFWALRVLNENGIYKVALDYANVGQTAILPGQSFEIDPTFTWGTSTSNLNNYDSTSKYMGVRLTYASAKSQVIDNFTLKLYKQGSPTGTIYSKIYKTSDNSLVGSCSTMSASSLTGSAADYTFTCTSIIIQLY